MRTNLLLFFMAGLLCLSIYSCETAAVAEEPPALDMDAITAELQAMEDAFATAEQARDVDGVMAYYSEDAISMPNGQPMLVGADAIRASMDDWATDTSEMGGSLSFQALEVFAEGDFAVEIGSFTSTSPEGEESTGKYMSLFEKRDGKYICIRDIWNLDSMDDAAKEEGEEMMEEEDEMEE